MKIDVLLVSDQIMPNLIVARMHDVDGVCLVCSKDMHKKGDDWSKILQSFNIPVKHRINDIHDTGMIAIVEDAKRTLQTLREKFPEAQFRLNATGGTKLMSFAFTFVFQPEDIPCLYADTKHQRIEILPGASHPGGTIFPMRNVLNVREYLRGQNLQVKSIASEDVNWQDSYQQRKVVAAHFAQQASNLSDFFKTMNALSYSAQNNNQLKQKFNAVPRTVAQVDALTRCVNAGLIQWKEGMADLVFNSQDAAKFLGGIWLEEYAYAAAQEAEVCDVQSGVKMVNPTNEFDVLACHINQLLFIECKTGMLGAKRKGSLEQNQESDNEVAYKLFTVGERARGLFGKTWLVLAQEPTEHMKNRAKEHRFEIIPPKELANLAQRIKKWMTV